jgi:hypothetical protein
MRVTVALLFFLGCSDGTSRPSGPVDSNLAAYYNGGGCYPEGFKSSAFDIITLANPPWVPVRNGRVIDSAPVMLHGTAHHAHGDTGGDDPITHQRADATVAVTPDDSDKWLLATGNSGGTVELELENGIHPPWAWAGDGDRLIALGRWIFDCGHPGGSPGACVANPAQKCNLDSDCADGDRCKGMTVEYQSEIHPPQALATIRQGRGAILDGSDPRPATRIDVWAGGNGGAAGDRCVLTHQDPVIDLVFSTNCYPLAQPVAPLGKYDFSFDAPLPPRPPGARAVWRIEPHDGAGPIPADVAITPHVDGAAPHLSVTVKLSHRAAAGMPTGFAGTIWAGWEAPASTPFVHVRVTVEAVDVTNALKPTTPGPPSPRDWRMQAGVNGEWQTFVGLDTVANGQSYAQGLVYEQYLPPDGTLRLQVDGTSSSCIDTLFNRAIRMSIAEIGSAGDFVNCLMTSNPSIGDLDVSYPGPTFGAGSYRAKSDHADGGACADGTPCVTDGDCSGGATCTPTSTAFTLRYKIETL